MGKTTEIAWTDHTFNPWWGCVKVSAGCAKCYAETFSKRTGNKVWGVNADRRFFGDKHWAEPLQWNAAAEKAGERRRVFCASMADVFERLPQDNPSSAQMLIERQKLLVLIQDTPWLDWQLLTKRPENIKPCLQDCYNAAMFSTDCETRKSLSGDTKKMFDCFMDVVIKVTSDWEGGNPPANVWLGTTVENQPAADTRIPILLQVPAAVRYLSVEPMLGPVLLDRVFMICKHWKSLDGDPNIYGKYWWERQALVSAGWQQGIHWVICGGESGPGARPMQPDWARSLRDQCSTAGVPFFFKQWGEHAPARLCHFEDGAVDKTNGRYWYEADPACKGDLRRLGKKKAGRVLDGLEYSEFPQVVVPA